MSARGVKCLGVRRYVRDVSRSQSFYVDLFGFELAPARHGGADLQFGEMRLELRTVSGKAHRQPRSQDRWFRHLAIVVRDMARAMRVLENRGVDLISVGPQTLPDWNPASGGIHAIYFRDPDGHPLELIAFPPGKGKPVWQYPGRNLFLGVDHTAIVVSDMDASLDYYVSLGFTLDATAHNHGLEQEALSGAPGASVRVAALAAGEGSFSLELLAYIAPADGYRQPDALMPGDLAWSETLIALPHADVETGAPRRDPDGHGVSLR